MAKITDTLGGITIGGKEVFVFDTFSLFPSVGSPDSVYIAQDSGIIYIWSGIIYEDVSNNYTASNIENVPSGNILSTNVQDALNEIDSFVVHQSGDENVSGTKTFSSSIIGLGFIKSGGLSTEFLKADGSVDNTTYENTINKGISNGYASLDSGGKIPASQLPNSVMELKGEWNATTNTPTLIDGVGSPGDVWKITVAGTQDLGSGNISFELGDFVIYGSSGVWFKSDNTDSITSVFGRTGTVISQSGDYTASQITNVPTGNISAVNIQSAINELDSEKAIDANVLHLSGNESFTGTKSSTVIASTPAISITNSIASGTSYGFLSLNTNLGVGIRAQATGTGSAISATTSNANGIAISALNTGSNGQAIYSTNSGTATSAAFRADNTGSGSGLSVSNTSTGTGVSIGNSAAATGKVFKYTKDSVEKFNILDNGTANYGTDLSSFYTLRTLVDKGYVDNAISTVTPTSRLLSINGVSQDLSTDREWRVAQADTGCLEFGGLSVFSTTAISCGVVKGWIIDNETDPSNPVAVYIDYAGGTNIPVTSIAGDFKSYVLIGAGNVFTFQNTQPTSEERKNKIWLGKVSHPNLTSISFTVDEPDYITSPLAFSRDMFQVIGPYINDGIIAYPNGANLSINVTNGNVHGNGINFGPTAAQRRTPNELPPPGSLTNISFTPRTQTGAGGAAITSVDVGNYDVAGTVTAIPGSSNRATIRDLFMVPGKGYVMQYGQAWYNDLNTAISFVGRETNVIYPNLPGNAIRLGSWVITKGCTALNNTATAMFFPADKFGQMIGATAGISTGTLQTAYGNSGEPEILTDSTRGSVNFKRGSAADTDNVLVVQNGAGTSVHEVTGNGDVTANSFIKSGGINTEYLMADGSVSTGSGGTLDLVPTNGSTNGVESNGVFDADQNLQDQIDIHSISISTNITDINTNTTNIALKQDKSISAYSVVANNTASTANASAQIFRSVAQQSLTSTGIVWTGTTPPSGTFTGSYSWQQIGNSVTLTLSVLYATQGTSLTEVSIPLPSDLPTPQKYAGVAATSNVISYGDGNLAGASMNVVTTPAVAGLRISTASTSAYELVIRATTAANSRYAFITVNYFTS